MCPDEVILSAAKNLAGASGRLPQRDGLGDEILSAAKNDSLARL